jgi:hypothetical protein
MKKDEATRIAPPLLGWLTERFRLDRSRLPLLLGIAACLAAAAAVRAVFVFKDAYATGFDGYYYALQVKSLIHNGEILNGDNSIVFVLLRLFSFFIPDVVAANKVAAIVLCSLAALPFFLLARRLTGSLAAAVAASLAFSLSFSQIYMTFEIVKNGVSVLFAAAALYCLARFFEGKASKAGALVFFGLAFFTHKAAAGTLIVMAAAHFAAYAWLGRKRLFRKWKPPHFVLAAFALAAIAAAVVAVLTSAGTLRLVDVGSLFKQLTFDSFLDRFRMFAAETTNLRIKAEYFLLYAAPLAFLPFLVRRLRARDEGPAGKAFLLAAYATQWVLLNPFLYFSWVSTSYRLLLMSSLFAALELGIMLSDLAGLAARARRAVLYASAASVIFLLSVSLPGMYRRFHTGRYPDYAGLAPAVMTLKTRLGPEDKLIAHQGLSFFIWYSTGIYTQHFLPESSEHYYRLVYGLGPAHFARYENEPGYEPAAVVRLPYVLVKEDVWRMFFRDYGDRLKVCRSWQNPSERRPETVYGVKPKFERRMEW